MTKTTATYGSQYWLQVLVNQAPHLIDQALLTFSESRRKSRSKDEIIKIKWRSPIAPTFREYKDTAFLDALGIELHEMTLDQFWPKGGPAWDGLANTGDDRVFLIEAKGHIPEINTNPTGARGPSLDLIQKSLQETREFLSVKNSVDWAKSFYQYTNRVAHLYLLREINGIDAFLINLYFFNDYVMRGPCSIEEWKGALVLLKSHLGLLRTKLSPFMLDIFINVEDLKKITSPTMHTDSKKA